MRNLNNRCCLNGTMFRPTGNMVMLQDSVEVEEEEVEDEMQVARFMAVVDVSISFMRHSMS